MKKTVAFIGAGNMGGVLVRQVCKAWGPEAVTVYAPTPRNTETLAKETGCKVADSAAQAAAHAHVVVLAVKPQVLPGVLKELAPCLQDSQLLVSIAAGITLETLEGIIAAAGRQLPVVRVMPNTPAALGLGMVLAAPGSRAGEPETELLQDMLSCCGRVELTGEKGLDMGTSVSGCSPAFVYMFIEALADGGVKIGLSRTQAQRWAAQAVMGAAAMVLETGAHPGALKDAVCSPGGTTIAGVAKLEEHGFRSTVLEAVAATYQRNRELSEH